METSSSNIISDDMCQNQRLDIPNIGEVNIIISIHITFILCDVTPPSSELIINEKPQIFNYKCMRGIHFFISHITTKKFQKNKICNIPF